MVAELQGFKKADITDIKLSVGQTAVVNATLSVGTVSETITVSSAARYHKCCRAPASNDDRLRITRSPSYRILVG